VIEDAQRMPYYSTNITVTSGWLNTTSNAATLSGTVTLLGSGKSGVPVELWASGAKTAETATGASGMFSFPGLAKGTTYTIKIPAGNTWAAAERSVALSASQSVTIALTAVTPSYAVGGAVKLEDTPVSGYRLSIYAAGAPNTAVATQTTDEDGLFSFTVFEGEYIIKGAATTDYKAYESASFEVSGANVSGQDIALALRPYIEGVASLGGTPKGGVYVYLYKDRAQVKSTTTDSNGKFTFKALDENAAYTLRVSGGSYAADDVAATTSASGKTETNITLTALVTVSGTVTLGDEPVSGAYVSLYAADSYKGSVYTNAGGSYSISGVKADGTTQYTLKVGKSVDYAAYASDAFALTENATKNIALTTIPKYSAAFTVSTIGDGNSFALYVYGNGIDTTEVKPEGGDYTIQMPEGNNYYYYYYYEGIYGSGSFAVTSSGAAVTVTLPTLYAFAGTVKDADENVVPGAAVNSAYGSTITDTAGKFSFKTTQSGTVNIAARHDTAGYGSASNVAANTTDTVITLAVNSVAISVKDASEGPISGAYVSLGSYSGYTGASGTLTLRNVGSGSFGYYAYKYGYLSASSTLAVDATGETQLAITLQEDPNLAYTFDLGISNSEIAAGGYVDIQPKLTYSGNVTPATGGKVTLTLPTGVTSATNPYANGGYTAVFEDGKTAKLPAVRVTVASMVGNLADLSIQASYTADTNINKYAYNTLTVVNATLTAPSVVQEDTEFTVYGTAPTGSIVAIKSGDAVLATAAVRNRYYTAKITMADAGEYELQAIAAAADGQTFASPLSPLTVTEEPAPTIGGVNMADGYLSAPVDNAQYGVKTFSTWVQTSEPYKGYYDIVGSFTVSNLGSYAVKNVSFAGAVTGEGTDTLTRTGGGYAFTFPKNAAWRGTGVKPIVVTLEKGGALYDFTIALVTIMLDPSGYIYDAVTDERIAGAEVTLETELDDNWVKWEDPDGLQANPQTSDEDGQYGWMVQDGKYRVRVTKTGYADAIADKEDGTYIDGITGFDVPPAQTEVNIALKYTRAPEATASWDSTNQKLTLAFTRPMPETATIAALSVEGIEGEWAASDDGKTFTFSPKETLAANSKIKLTIEASVLSEDGVAIGDVTIPEVTVTAKPSDGPGGTGSGGGGSSSKPDEEPGDDGEGDGGSAGSPAAPWQNPFSDVAESDWFYGDVEYAFANGLMNGMSAAKFEPNSRMTRAMLVTVLYRLAGEPEVSGGSGFSDVAAGQWYTDAVAWAAGNGIVNGIGGGKFAPDSNITRQDIAVVLSRYAESAGKELAAVREPAAFADSGEIAGYAKDAVAALNAAGIINGVGSNRVNPRGEATRAEVAAMLHRYIEA
jgi:hypothetical protein